MAKIILPRKQFNFLSFGRKTSLKGTRNGSGFLFVLLTEDPSLEKALLIMSNVPKFPVSLFVFLFSHGQVNLISARPRPNNRV